MYLLPYGKKLNRFLVNPVLENTKEITLFLLVGDLLVLPLWHTLPIWFFLLPLFSPFLLPSLGSEFPENTGEPTVSWSGAALSTSHSAHVSMLPRIPPTPGKHASYRGPWGIQRTMTLPG